VARVTKRIAHADLHTRGVLDEAGYEPEKAAAGPSIRGARLPERTARLP
jgi:hypothetical protein